MGKPTQATFKKLFKEIEDKGTLDSKDMLDKILATVKDISKEGAEVIRRMIAYQMYFKKGYMSEEEYEDTLDYQKIQVKNFLIGIAFDTVNIFFRFLQAFVKWAEPIVKAILSQWIVGLAAKNGIKMKL